MREGRATQASGGWAPAPTLQPCRAGQTCRAWLLLWARPARLSVSGFGEPDSRRNLEGAEAAPKEGLRGFTRDRTQTCSPALGGTFGNPSQAGLHRFQYARAQSRAAAGTPGTQVAVSGWSISMFHPPKYFQISHQNPRPPGRCARVGVVSKL